MTVCADVQVGPARLSATWQADGGAAGVVILVGAGEGGGAGAAGAGTASGLLAGGPSGLSTLLLERGLATLRLDLLNAADAAPRRKAFEIELLAARLVDAIVWVLARPGMARTPIGLLAAGTAAAAALRAAATVLPERVCAVVSLAGRPDLAEDTLRRVQVPTLLVVGAHDATSLGLNRGALSRLRCTRQLAVVPGARRLFDTPGQVQQLARLCGDWYTRHRPPGAAPEVAAMATQAAA